MAAQTGDTILVHYTGTLDDGTVFDSSQGGEPLEATLGDETLIPGFENALLGMNLGDRKTVSIPADEAYGEHVEELILTVPRESVPSHLNPAEGMMVQLTTDKGEEFEAMITAVSDESVTLDANHPLAGETLTFDLEVVEIRPGKTD